MNVWNLLGAVKKYDEQNDIGQYRHKGDQGPYHTEYIHIDSLIAKAVSITIIKQPLHTKIKHAFRHWLCIILAPTGIKHFT